MARMEDEWVSLTDHAAHYAMAALRAPGTDVLAAHPPADSDEPEAVGTKLFRLIFAGQTGEGDFDEQLAALARDPDGQAAQDALEGLIGDALEDDPEVAAAVLGTLTAFYRRQAQAGNVQALADLGNLLKWEDDFDGARAAYQQAIDAGRHESLIDMAYLLRLTDDDAARACLDQALTIGDPDLTAQALVTLSLVLERSDPEAAQSALVQAIETGHEDWAPAAMSDLGDLRRQQGDDSGAREAYQQAIGTGHPVWAGEARFSLATMLEEQRDLAGAREQFQRLVEMGHEHWAPAALESLIQPMRDDGDLDGLRALHHTAVQTSNRSAPEVLVAIGELLDERGEADGARLAYQQAIDDGYYWADDLIEKLHPSPKPTTAELDALPSQFDPRNIVRTGLEVLSYGLPQLPDRLSYLMAIPVAYWTTERSAVVLFLQFRRHGRQHHPGVLHVTYSRDDDGWIANRHFIGMGYSHDPVANAGSLRDLGGSAMVTGGGSDTIRHGRASPAIKYIALLQDGREDLRPLESHFGAWVVSTGQSSPFQIEGRDADGNVLARIGYDPDEHR
jgi:tetratricopeptide (TPR) repeat protein